MGVWHEKINGAQCTLKKQWDVPMNNNVHEVQHQIKIRVIKYKLFGAGRKYYNVVWRGYKIQCVQ
jgi:hypothetical protein